MALPLPDFDSLLANYHLDKQDAQQHVVEAPIAKQHGKTCSVCNIVFPSRDKLYIHLSNHVSCEHEGCDFVGTSKTVSEHRQTEHDAIAATLFKMESPELLTAWIAQRKKNFPTQANVESKMQCKKRRIERGIVAGDKTFSFKGGSKWAVKREKCKDEAKENIVEQPTVEEPLRVVTGEVAATEGLVSHSGGLGGLVGYDSSSDEEGEIIETPISVINPIQTEAYVIEANKDHVQTPEGTEAQPKAPAPSKEVQQQLKKFKQYAKILAADGKKRKVKKVWNGVLKSGRRRHQPTLLQRLLTSEIKNHHNTVLQCVRYIVKNDFFQDG